MIWKTGLFKHGILSLAVVIFSLPIVVGYKVVETNVIWSLKIVSVCGILCYVICLKLHPPFPAMFPYILYACIVLSVVVVLLLVHNNEMLLLRTEVQHNIGDEVNY